MQPLKTREISGHSWYTESMSIPDKKRLPFQVVVGLFPPALRSMLARVHAGLPGKIFIAGGTVRDLLLGRKPSDIDLTVVRNAREWASQLAAESGGTYILLGREEDAARVAWKGMDIDFSSFRGGAASIETELRKRDITINSMAVPVHDLLDAGSCDGGNDIRVIDPVHGLEDLAAGVIRVTSQESFRADPLRMLRAFRFAAVLGFVLAPDVSEQVHRQRQAINSVSSERIAHELDLIMGSGRAYSAFRALHDCGLLWEILPELKAGAGMEQPASHHLDVFDHCLEALGQMEQVLNDPSQYFPGNNSIMEQYLRGRNRSVLLKWAALFHDVGKPVTFGINEDKGGRITFYNHDLQGADIFTVIARRLRWSGRDTVLVARLIAGHMRPFFLANNERQGSLTVKACLRLIRAIGEDLPGLFLLAMADALAGKGENSPEEMEKEVADLFARMVQVEKKYVAPVRSAQPLITGNDLIQELKMTPGPMFRQILEHVEEAHMEQLIHTRQQALTLAEQYIKSL